MRLVLTPRSLLGWVLAAVGLGILLGDVGARIMGWDGPATMQAISVAPIWVGAWLVEAERRAARRGAA